jgi:hypothetical protein
MSTNWEVVGTWRTRNISNGDALTDEVEVDLNMLGALMLDGIGREVDCADVVTIDQSGLA